MSPAIIATSPGTLGFRRQTGQTNGAGYAAPVCGDPAVFREKPPAQHAMLYLPRGLAQAGTRTRLTSRTPAKTHYGLQAVVNEHSPLHAIFSRELSAPFGTISQRTRTKSLSSVRQLRAECVWVGEK